MKRNEKGPKRRSQQKVQKLARDIRALGTGYPFLRFREEETKGENGLANPRRGRHGGIEQRGPLTFSLRGTPEKNKKNNLESGQKNTTATRCTDQKRRNKPSSVGGKTGGGGLY